MKSTKDKNTLHIYKIHKLHCEKKEERHKQYSIK